jgi:hypothetical protein
MTTLSARNQLYAGLALAGLMLATRSHYFASMHHLPHATWAVFFLAGVYLRPAWAFPALFAAAATSDYVAVTWGGVSGFCITKGYATLPLAYGSLWLAGRWSARQQLNGWSSLAAMTGAALISATAAGLLSSGGFYFLGGRYVDPTLAEFGQRFVKYFPHNLTSMAIYLGLAAILHGAIAGALPIRGRRAGAGAGAGR